VALTKSRAAITQLTASGTSTTLDVSASYQTTCYIKHVNGTGTITGQGTAVVQVRTNGGTEWYDLTEVGFGTTASDVVEVAVDVPADADDVQIVYTAPAGSTGHTLDAEVGTITSL